MRTKEEINGIIYISGKMRGLKKQTYEAHFRKAVNELIIMHGVHPSRIINPCYIGNALKAFHDDDILRLDLIILERCNAIYMLNNWEDSRGAKAEKQKAEELGLKIYYEPQQTSEPKRSKKK